MDSKGETTQRKDSELTAEELLNRMHYEKTPTGRDLGFLTLADVVETFREQLAREMES